MKASFNNLTGFELSVYVDITEIISIVFMSNSRLFPSFLCVSCSNLSMFKSCQIFFEHFVLLVVFAFTPLAERHPILEIGYMHFLFL